MKWIALICVGIPGLSLAQSQQPAEEARHRPAEEARHRPADEARPASQERLFSELSEAPPTPTEELPGAPPTPTEDPPEAPPTPTEELPGAPPTPTEELSETPEVPASGDGLPLEVRSELENAIRALVAGNYATARQTIDGMVERLGSDHWMGGSLEQLRLLVNQVEDQAEAVSQARAAARDEESVASLYTTMTLFGLYTGIWLFAIVAEMDVQAAVPLSVVTAGVGLGGAYVLDHRDQPLTGAMADGISAGLLLGAAEAGLALLAFTPDMDGKGVTSAIWGASAVGGIVGGLVVDATDASRGDVSLATSAYGWGAVLGLTIAGVGDASGDGFAELTLAGATVGLGAGFVLANYVDMSPSRILYVNLGGLAGSLVGLGAAVGARANTQLGALLIGGLYFVGLGVSAQLTRNLDDHEPGSLAWQTTPTLIPPVAPGQQPAAGLAFRLSW